MQHNKNITFRVCAPTEIPNIIDFFWSLKEELRLKERASADAIVPLLFEKGGIIGGYVKGENEADKLVCAFGYFLGEPTRDYANQETGLVYIAGIAKAYRRARVFTNGAHFLVTMLQPYGVTELRCHAGADDPYTNGIYARFGEKIATEPNRSGHLCNLYANSVNNVLAMTERLTRMNLAQTGELVITS